MGKNIDGFDALLAIHQNFTPQNFPLTIRTVETHSSCNTRSDKGAGYILSMVEGEVEREVLQCLF